MKHLKQTCEGATITRLEEKKGEGHNPRMMLHLSNGAILWVASDTEGNGDGFLHIEREPTSSATSAPWFDPKMIGKRLRSTSGKILVVKGYHPRRPKYPVTLEDLSGKAYKATVAAVRTWQEVTSEQ